MTDTAIRLLRYVLPKRHWYRHYYLKSAHWAKARAEAKQRAGGRCERCGVRGTYKALEVHHVSYQHIWREYPVDLQVLCHDCHFKLHRRRGY